VGLIKVATDGIERPDRGDQSDFAGLGAQRCKQR
jgi:hypothetical protein